MALTGANSASPDLLPVGTVWVGPRLNWIARLALHSFVKAGHPTTLYYTGDPIDPEVDGVAVISAKEVWDYPEDLLDRVSPAVFSDFFRLHMMQRASEIWVDTDALCYRPLQPRDGYLVGIEHGGWINGAVLLLPQGSPSLNALIAAFDDPTGVPEWLPKSTHDAAVAADPDHALYEACNMVPNGVGPRALSYMLPHMDEADHVLDVDALNPLPWGMADAYFNPHGGVEGWLSDDTMVLHLYTSRIRKLHREVLPLPGSFIDRFAREIGFDLSSCGLRHNTTLDTMH